ncbi:MAG: ABC transporter ATP-binding protein [Candidatus Schekmanbacteria bacterium]|nr:MAG: ABC transporter ATP-binding protein [Candidatus Schekmanbacteria bacterium]
MFIEVKNLKKAYPVGDEYVWALNGIDLGVDKGEFVAILGASGSGKSTFMNILGCLDVPTEGKFYFEGKDTSRLSPNELAELRNKRIGFVFQGFNLLSRTTAVENVELPLIYSGISSKERRARALKALQDMGIEKRAFHFSNQLSGGQQQRVAIARALVNNPSLILADEPTGNLDTKTSREIMEIFTSLNKDKGITIVMVTHESDIAAYAQRRIVFSDGKIISDEGARVKEEGTVLWGDD